MNEPSAAHEPDRDAAIRRVFEEHRQHLPPDDGGRKPTAPPPKPTSCACDEVGLLPMQEEPCDGTRQDHRCTHARATARNEKLAALYHGWMLEANRSKDPTERRVLRECATALGEVLSRV